MGWREHVETIWRDKCGRFGTFCCRELSTCASASVDTVHQPRLADRNVHKAAGWIEEGRIWNSSERPLATHFSDGCIYLNEGPAVAGDIQPVPLMINIDPVRARRREVPELNPVKLGQPRHQDHRGVSDCKEHSRAVSIGHAPSWAPGKIDFPSPVSFEIQNLEHRIVGFVSDASHNCQHQAWNKSNSIRSQPRFELFPLFQ
jgi:hypothetical protein